ncbi:MAG: hypothetical protein CVV57_00650 [Tenericutes bacterium HGW-Tenericutes-2]|jgi:diguanylate cyclase (GGDEF)-like protein|nr:MAG: hypothetical protein CVV57_00650 [Tenericutes bacterium HGW-Tenericutes-2]
MLYDGTILRLFLSQAIAMYFLLILIPIKQPIKKNITIIISSATLVVFLNAWIILNLGISFYTRFYFLSLVLPFIILFSFFAVHKGAKLIFSLLSIQVIGNVGIINGLLASYIFYGENNPYIDTIARVLTYLVFLPIILKYIRPTYLKMVKMIHKGWWILNAALIASYALSYFILFVPDPVFYRPLFFIHAYIAIFLSLLIYTIIFFLFIEIQSKIAIEQDKLKLSTQVEVLAAESMEITSIAYKDSLTGINNRYSLYRKMDILTQNNQPFLVVFIDIDDLKSINDAHDHTKGDCYLKEFALIIGNIIGDQGEVYRFAGDEFVCLITQNPSEFNIDHFKEDVINKFQMDVPFQGMSLGTAFYPNDGLIPDELISYADQAMYAEKKIKNMRR